MDKHTHTRARARAYQTEDARHGVSGRAEGGGGGSPTEPQGEGAGGGVDERNSEDKEDDDVRNGDDDEQDVQDDDRREDVSREESEEEAPQGPDRGRHASIRSGRQIRIFGDSGSFFNKSTASGLAPPSCGRTAQQHRSVVKWLEDRHEVELLHVLRRFNKEADALANAGMDRPAAVFRELFSREIICVCFVVGLLLAPFSLPSKTKLAGRTFCSMFWGSVAAWKRMCLTATAEIGKQSSLSSPHHRVPCAFPCFRVALSCCSWGCAARGWKFLLRKPERTTCAKQGCSSTSGATRD